MVINKKESVIFLISGLLGVVLLFWVFKAFFPPRKQQTLAKKPSPSASPKGIKNVPSSSKKIEAGRLKSSYSSWGRNPFIPGSLIESSGRLILKGIVWDKLGAFAIINDMIVRKGDEIKGSKVIEIEEDKVIINDGQGNFELKLRQ